MRRAARVVAFNSTSSTRASSSSRASCSSSSSLRRFRKASVETHDAPCGTGTEWHGRSFATSVPLNSTKPGKGQRLPKDKRRVLVEAFVEKYKNANAGKFPTTYYTREQVGGSYYIIKDILQMLEYESKNSSMKKREEITSGKLEQHIDNNINVKEQDPNSLTSKSSISLEEPTDIEAGVITVTDKIYLYESQLVKVEETSRKPLSSANVGSLDNDEVMQLNHARDSSSYRVELKPPVFAQQPFDNGTSISDSSQKHSIELETSKENMSDSKALQQDDSWKLQRVNQEVPEPEDIHRDASGGLRHEELLPKSPSVWSNLKSLANGIINFWKKA